MAQINLKNMRNQLGFQNKIQLSGLRSILPLVSSLLYVPKDLQCCV
jgi:hypothetical protein